MFSHKGIEAIEYKIKIVLRPTQAVGGLAADQWKYPGKVMWLRSVGTDLASRSCTWNVDLGMRGNLTPEMSRFIIDWINEI